MVLNFRAADDPFTDFEMRLDAYQESISMALAPSAAGREGEVDVEVHQLVRDLKGNLLADKMVRHVFRIENGLIKRFDIQGA